MGRKFAATAAPIHDEFTDPALADKVTELQHAAGGHAVAVREATGEVAPYERRTVLAGLRGLMAQGAQIMLEIGRVLVFAREHETAEGFQSLIDEAGMDRRTAQRFMQAAVKFRLSLTAAQSVRFDHLSRGKLYELLVLDDDQIAELADGGSVAGLHLDAIHTMSTTELRAKVREAEAKLEAKDRVLDKRAEQIEQLEAEVDRLTHARPPEQVLIAQEREAELIAMLQEAMLGVLGAVTQWEAAIAACLSEPSTARTTLATEATRFLFQRLAQVSEEHNLPVDFAAVAAPPDWLSQVAGAQA